MDTGKKKNAQYERKGRPGLFEDRGAVIAFMQEMSQACRNAVPQKACTIIDLARAVNAKFLPPDVHNDLTVRQAVYKLVRRKSGNRVVNINGIWTSRKGFKPKKSAADTQV
jgi:hypothetical protein